MILFTSSDLQEVYPKSLKYFKYKNKDKEELARPNNNSKVEYFH